MHKTFLITTIIFTILLSFPSGLDLSTFDNPLWLYASEIQFYEDNSECTTGVASGAVTQDGRPLLWKNRDVGNANQECHYVDDGRLPFISIAYAGVTVRYFAGVNTAGFGLENSDAHNNGGHFCDLDGYLMAAALATCRTVDDFEAFLDSTNETNRIYAWNFGVIDAFGGAAMFEAGPTSYVRFDADETEDGFIIRSNFAFTGNQIEINHERGLHRYDRAYQLWKHAIDNDELNPLFIFQQVARDLSLPDVDPHPLPFDGYYGEYPYGCLPNYWAICRSTSRSVMVLKGVADGENPDDSILWAMLGSPVAGIATPLWVRAGSVPYEYDGEITSPICDRVAHISNSVNVECIIEDRLRSAVDTWQLTNPECTGIQDFTLPIEEYIFNKTERFLASPQFTYERLEAFQNEATQDILDSLLTWRPTYSVTERFEAIYEDNNVILIWDEADNERFRQGAPRGYTIYRSNCPFREGDRGQQLAFVEDNRYVDRDAASGRAFYRVEVAF
ncbi:MAG: hypothetical protein P9X24_13730 [Candidatus Hatepunaea meridiana]|nr:hypothetical protein [Candidatus Hatepunaea meridiana]